MNENKKDEQNKSVSLEFERKNVNLKNTNDNETVEEFDTDDDEENSEVDDKKKMLDNSNDYSKHLTYEGDLCIYNDPVTKKQMTWDVKSNAWIPRETEPSTSNDSMKNYEFDGENYIYTDTASNVTYKFDQKENKWLVKDNVDDNINTSEQSERSSESMVNPVGIYGFENDTHTYTDPNDGSVSFWDREKKAWFPKIDDDFMAKYQMSYGHWVEPSTTNNSKVEIKTKADIKELKEQKKAEAKRKAAEPPTWFEIDEAHNTAIYISGLPVDITIDELVEIVTKYGMLLRDDKNKPKLKLYMDADGQPKGDALCTYIKVESVNLALDVLNGSQLRGKTISVERAKFQMKGQFDPALKPKRKKNYKERQKKIHEKLLGWQPDRLPNEPLKNERIVIIKNLFAPTDFDKDVQLLLEYQQDIRSECVKCGEVKKVTLYDRHPEGVAQVTFREPTEAQTCIQLLNGRWFGQRQITAEIWDGKTKYKINETEAEIEARIDKWEEYLDDGDDKKSGEVKAETSKSEKNVKE